MEQGYVDIQDPKNGVHITGTRFAIVYWKKQFGLIEVTVIDGRVRREVIAWYDSAVNVTAGVVGAHVSRVISAEIKSISELIEVMTHVAKLCKTAIEIIDPKHLGGVR
ncbi:DUF5405 family protein [Proteus mirabilis]|uniref:DUF5405 family protein n=1 Tax=Proteus mirabilis TaxID=584 RepID=UPI00101C213C|nr:DUF5405 family protein [Proteus mirabilis]RYI09692.1 hypothetical protein EVX97_08880 [Proteus mirabilis]HCR4049951.1 DUF5405 family protein [Proteus mirabilis]HEJ9721310.1 DUF5405 family protein [Proteus mirabilis]HEK0447954.1 DUF5405 family protein [Proteus mirabilis]HEK1800840.1 DUF5405 family protein [Proteus mirabilis]